MNFFRALVLSAIGLEVRGGLVFLDKEMALLKWMNCSIVPAAMPILRSSQHEAFTQEPFREV